jgi:DNA-binding transcriptional LysR family regulator
MRISELERITGVPLVNRTTRSVGLTEAGHRLVAECAPAFERIDAGYTSVKDLSDTPSGILRVTAPVAFGRQRLAPILTAFLQSYPDISVQIELTDRLVNLTHEGFDVAIRHTSVAPDNYVAWALCETRSVLVASAKYLERCGIPNHPEDLINHACLSYLDPSKSDVWIFLPIEAGHHPTKSISVPVTGPLKANNSEMLREAVIDGLGIGLLPDFSATSPSDPALEIILPDWRVQGFFGNRIYALRPPATRVSRAVQCFIEHLRETFGKESKFELA